jgi:non-heme chloroperoxidase
VGGLEAFVRLCIGAEPKPADLYFMLGYNVIVPPHVRLAMLSRVLDYDDVLARLSLPVLITQGEEDRVVLPAAADQHARTIPHARTSTYPGVGHMPFWEDAARFNRELRDFAVQARIGARA